MYASKAFVFVAAAASESWDRKNLEVCMKPILSARVTRLTAPAGHAAAE